MTVTLVDSARFVRYDGVADLVIAVVVVEVSCWLGAAGSLMEMAHGPVVWVSDWVVAGWAPVTKGWFLDYLATAYADGFDVSGIRGYGAFVHVDVSV